MRLLKYVFIFSLLFYTVQIHTKIHIVCTAALIDNQATIRKDEYIHAINIIKKMGYDPYIIEACKKQGPTFLDLYAEHVFYSSLNDAALKNKGVNEGKTLLQGLKHFQFNDNDIVIKLTGRYHFISDYLIHVIKQNPLIDGFFLLIDSNKQIFTGCFAMRYKHLIAMLESFDYTLMELNMSNIEWECMRYIQYKRQNGHLQTLYVDKLDVQGKIFGYGNVNLNEMSVLSW